MTNTNNDLLSTKSLTEVIVTVPLKYYEHIAPNIYNFGAFFKTGGTLETMKMAGLGRNI